MAKIGLRNFLFGILTEESDGSATYGNAVKPAKAISCNVSINNNDASLYADDALAESDSAATTSPICATILVTIISLEGTLTFFTYSICGF